MSQWMLSEFECPDCGVFEELIAKPVPDEHDCPTCGALSPWVMSAPKPKVLSVPCYAVQRGGDTERRPGMLDTRPLAEGMPMKEWRALQDKGRQERRHQQLVKKGIKQKRIQVG